MLLLALTFACFPLGWLLTRQVCKLAPKLNLVAVPENRSAHQVTTPTGGGIAIQLVVTSYLLVFAVLFQSVAVDVFGLILSATLIGLTGLVDDYRPIAPAWRLFAQGAGVVIFLCMLDRLPEIQLGTVVVLAPWILLPAYAIALVWWINLFNFMDGIDAIAAVETITVLLGGIVIMLVFNGLPSVWMLPMMALCLAVAGFLVLNWPPAKLFMGDVGSGFVALIGLAMMTAAEQSISIWSWLILCGVFVIDASVTLVGRTLNKETIFNAHSSHAYQKIARHWQSHSKVVIAVAAVNLVWLAPLAYYATVSPENALILVFVAYLPIAVIVGWVRRSL